MKARNTLDILCVSDLHHYTDEELEEIQSMEYDVCLLLGDIPQKALKIIKKANGSRPIYGICGNHDDWDSLKRADIEDIHCKMVEVGNIKIAGFGGSHRYKSGDYAMITQEQSIQAAKTIPAADILISHDCPYKMFGKDIAHEGLIGISNYIAKYKPYLNLCGHYHESMQSKFKNCKVECIYRFRIVKFVCDDTRNNKKINKFIEMWIFNKKRPSAHNRRS